MYFCIHKIMLETMENDNYKPRLIDKHIGEMLEIFGALCVEGPKWCGKSWTSAHHSASVISLANPADNFQNRRMAEMSPDLVLDGAEPRLVDEWQEVPPIWDAVRYKVDESTRKGRYILTGSATPNHKGIMHSGAGRIARIRMRPMSLFESGNSSGKVSLEAICDGTLPAVMTGNVQLSKIVDLIVRGGWPASLNLSIERAMQLPRQYLKAVIEDDVYRIDGVKRDTAKINLLLRSLARNESTTVSNKTIKNDIKAIDDEDIDLNTIASYLDVLNRLFLLDNLQPFSGNLRSSLRLKQMEKRRFVDPSLACALLKITPKMLFNDLNTLGFMFESLCVRDLIIYSQMFDGQVFHYQDYNGNEIDAVIEMPDGGWCAFEIKLGANQIDAAAANLLKIRDKIAKDPNGRPPKALCVISGLGSAAYTRPDGVMVVPISALRE